MEHDHRILGDIEGKMNKIFIIGLLFLSSISTLFPDLWLGCGIVGAIISLAWVEYA